MDVVTKEQMIKLEKIGAEEQKITYDGLMENAGLGAYKIIKEKFIVNNKSFLIFADKGNNGGDALVVARHLLNDTTNITVVFTNNREDINQQVSKLKEKNNNFLAYMWEDFNKDKSYDYIIDGIYGTGFKGNLNEKHKEICKYINNSKTKIISLDIPSGANCDTGQTDEDTVKASMTITFHKKKPCHILYPSKEFCGEIIVCDIGIDETGIIIDGESIFEITEQMVSQNILSKAPTLHKASAGKVLLIGGKMGLGGAMVMAALGALKSGCGYLNVVITQKLYEIFAPSLISCTFTIVQERGDGGISETAIEDIMPKLSWADSVIIGCGMGTSAETKELVRFVVDNFAGDVVIDADGLNSIDLEMLKNKKCNIVITPHYKEMARLLHQNIEYVIDNRIKIAKDVAKEYGITVLLKSHQTIVANQNGDMFVNTTGNSGMAKAGSGDVLSGIIGSLLSQKAKNSAACGCYIHGLAGDICKETMSEFAMQPINITNYLSDVFNKIK